MTRKERYMLKEEKIVVDIKLKLSRKMRSSSSSSSSSSRCNQPL